MNSRLYSSLASAPALAGARPTLDLEQMQRHRDAALRAGNLTQMLHAEAGVYALLSGEEEVALTRRIRAGGPDAARAREQFVAANIRLVAQIARRYLAPRRAGSAADTVGGEQVGAGVELDDLVEDGMLGLLRAVELFDPDAGNKFSTYATWWIRQSIARALVDRGSTIRTPSYMVERQRRLRRVANELEAQTGVTPSVETLAAAAELTPAQAQEALRLAPMGRAPLSLDEVLVNTHHARASADPLTRGDITPDPDAEARFEAIEASADARSPDPEGVLSLMRALLAEGRAGQGPDVEREFIILLRRELQGHTLDAISADLGISRERVRQLELRAMQRIRERRALLRRRATRRDQAQARRTRQQSREQEPQEQDEGGVA